MSDRGIESRRLRWVGQVSRETITYLLTEPSPSWEAANYAATQEIPNILWKPQVHHRVHKNPPRETGNHVNFWRGNSWKSLIRKAKNLRIFYLFVEYYYLGCEAQWYVYVVHLPMFRKHFVYVLLVCCVLLLYYCHRAKTQLQINK
jgi:hypothetical protein